MKMYTTPGSSLGPLSPPTLTTLSPPSLTQQKLDVSIPMAPSLRFVVGTDVKLADRDLGYDLTYRPNFQWGITESWFNGTIEVDTMNKEVKYTKIFDLDAVALKVGPRCRLNSA